MTEHRTDARPPTSQEAEPSEVVVAALAERVRELKEANARLAREVQEGRLMELALRESETRLQDLALTTADWLWEVDANGRYTTCSDRVKDVLGYTPDEIIGRTPFDLMLEDDVAAIGPVFERMIREHEGCAELRNRARHKDGHEVVLLTSCVPMLNGAGQLLGFRGVDKDITQRDQMERSLLRQTRELEALLEAGSAMVACIDYDQVLRRVARSDRQRAPPAFNPTLPRTIPPSTKQNNKPLTQTHTQTRALLFRPAPPNNNNHNKQQPQH